MGKKLLTVILMLLVLSGLGFYYVYRQSRERIAKFEAIPKEEQIQYVEDCEKALLDSGRDYVICSLDPNGNLYLSNDKRIFKPGEYVGVQVNVQKLNQYFDPYYVCIHSNFPNYRASVPDRYHTLTQFRDLSLEGEIEYEVKYCSKILYQRDYHHAGFSGFVADLPGKYILGEIFLFPGINFTSKEDFFNNLDKSILVFNMTGEIE
jgi:hypothetical protein